jgi:hypothetical protein
MEHIDNRPPSEAQYKLVQQISETLEVPMPISFDMTTYREYISHYYNKFKVEKQKYDEDLEDEY